MSKKKKSNRRARNRREVTGQTPSRTMYKHAMSALQLRAVQEIRQARSRGIPAVEITATLMAAMDHVTTEGPAERSGFVQRSIFEPLLRCVVLVESDEEWRDQWTDESFVPPTTTEKKQMLRGIAEFLMLPKEPFEGRG